ncbi:hypothetical protein [Streptomyces sp. NPDC005017]|uniref:hypothetical protein n=1 Tax=Streptomyces sp. NPDC005017 TaxID=3364706 RepID=UPI0036C2A6DA
MNSSPAPGQDHHHTTPSPAATGTGTPHAQHTGHAPQAIPHPQSPTGPHPPQTPAATALLGLRSAIILMLGTLVGTGAGILTHLAQPGAPTAVLTGGAAFAGAVLFFHAIIAT